MIHELKTWPEPFKAVKEGLKTFEYRWDDRHFQAGDTLLLREFDPYTGLYSGDKVEMEVTYLMRGPLFGIPKGHCIMSIKVKH